MRNTGLALALLWPFTFAAWAQSPIAVAALPAAPAPAINLTPQAPPPAPNSAGGAQRLSRTEAEQLALKNNPRVSVSRLLALAQHQVVREARAAELPTANAAITAEKALEASRISAGSLTASRLFTHAGAGGNFTQLITDFGRTHNLVLTQKFQEKAANATALATKEEIVLAADQAFYDALTAQAILQVAQQTVNARQATQTQVNQMTQNKLKSTLDLSFADVNLSQSKLLQLDAQNNLDASMATLDAVLGLDHEVTYQLVDDGAHDNAPPTDFQALEQSALAQRPDLQSLTFGQQSAEKFARAQWDQLLPSINAAGTVGTVPVRVDQYYLDNWWGGIGVNVNIPIFNGFLYSSEAKEAKYRALADAQRTRDLRDQIVRDVRTAWLQANTAYQRIGVTAELLKEADMSLQLAQARYKLGLSSIVELSQAQLQQTSAAIDNTNAQYEYRLARAVLNYQIGTTP
ncbi:MAG TPA: TolC family protein [Acidobacteriaceae bacterium]|nr:TolC family protein [Acidobacteriaceae bacterium]